MTEVLNEKPNKRSFQQEAINEILEAEALGIDCTALKQHLVQIDAMGFDPEQHTFFNDEPLQKPPLPPSRY